MVQQVGEKYCVCNTAAQKMYNSTFYGAKQGEYKAGNILCATETKRKTYRVSVL
jgi:hypothetical protein